LGDWIDDHKSSIQFIVWMVVGITMIMAGIFDGRPELIALGAGALGLPGFASATKKDDP
jgi:hypothetical protein